MKNPTHLPANYDAEGSPDSYEKREPIDPTRTSTLPVIRMTVLNEEDSLSETGNTDVIDVPTEGKDDAETQDATLTRDETRTSPASADNTDDEDTADDLETVEEIDTSAAGDAQAAPILIVEDTVELAEVIQATIENMGMEAIYATHGSTGLERLKEHSPRLVIMDIGLPDITGWKMLDSIKSHYESVTEDMPPIIVITAYGDPANRLIGKLQNIHSYLLKPFTPDQVEKLVTMAMAGEKPEDPFFNGESDKA